MEVYSEDSSQRHWHTSEDELVYVLQGELVLIEDDGQTILRAGDCATFQKNTGNGHHMVNRSDEIAVYLEVGSRSPEDVTYCSDIDLSLIASCGLASQRISWVWTRPVGAHHSPSTCPAPIDGIPTTPSFIPLG
jgi:uncharacterized cupin superfamily protein